MKVRFFPTVAHGTVCAPPSKSVAHRALICGALSKCSTVSGLAWSEDISATCDCLRAMGAKIERLSDDTVAIGGLTLAGIPDGAVLPCRESGSTLRFLLPIAMLSRKMVHFTGSARLMERPLGIYEEISARQGGLFRREGQQITVCGGLKVGEYEIAGNISSQFITGLLLALSLADGESRVRVTEPFESRSYTDITVDVLREYGIPVGGEGNEFVIPGRRDFSDLAYTVEGDCSNAAFLEALALLSSRSFDPLRVTGVPEKTSQGDRVYYEMLHEMAAGRKEFDVSDCPDLAPCLFAMAAFYGGAHFTGTARLAIKESDRGAAMAEELACLGAEVTVGANEVTVACEGLREPTRVLNGHNDHRIVMALSVLCTVTGGEIDGAEAVAKSYPDFFEVIAGAGIALEIEQ
ncbi:MAG: 3-phosphoshikimate 1-carboxyvinyltransferase [Lachnospiraceae bacterium]|nr:3-phosphoshikimate 1-carboxyvinyltransferase [Lachnospiraceae bacterium]